MDLSGKIFCGKYKIMELVGEGGMSFVYKAQDLGSGQVVAIKLMKPNVTSKYFDDLARFKRAITAVTRLKHQGVLRVMETGEHENQPFLVMEFLNGESLADRLKRNYRFKIDESVKIVMILAEVLGYVHDQGIIHRDLKPANIFISGSKEKPEVKIIDFGVSLLIELGAILGENEIAGTFGYMSPEATGILKRRVDERSDLYSLGIIFYQLLAGASPFKAADIASLIHRQSALHPQKIRLINPEIPKILEGVIMKLLMKDPDHRYQSAQGLLHDLKRLSQGEYDFIIGEKDPALKLSFQSSLVGREKEWNKLVELFNQTLIGKGSLCLIAGEPGIGKSRLIEDFGVYVREQKGLFIHGKCFNYRNKTPYQPFKDVTDDYMRQIAYQTTEVVTNEKIRVKKLIADKNGILSQLNPRLIEYIGGGAYDQTNKLQQDTQRFLIAAAEFFCKLGECLGTAVVFLDDLQWVDEASLGLLMEILKNLRQSNVLLIVAYRDRELSDEHILQRIRQVTLGQANSLTQMQLGPLDKHILIRLTSQLLHQNATNLSVLNDYLYGKSQGNPFFAIYILRNLVDSNVLYWRKGNWRIDDEKLRSFPVAGNLIDIIIQRINCLSPDQVRLLCKGAILGREFSVTVFAELSGLDYQEFITRVEEIIGLQLLERCSVRNRLAFVHDRIREAFFIIITDLEKTKIHLEIATILERMEQLSPGDFIFELAHHYLEGKNPEKALPYVIQAADAAKASYANETALQHYLSAREMLEQRNLQHTPVWLKICIHLAEVYQAIGDVDQTIELGELLLPYLNEPEELARIHRLLALAFNKKGEWSQSIDHALQALRILGEKIPTRKSAIYFGLFKEILIHLGHNLFRRNDYIRTKAKTGRDEKELNRPFVISRLLYNLNWVSVLTGQRSAANARMIMRMLNQAESELGASFELGLATTYYGSVWAALGRFSGAHRQFERAISVLMASGGDPLGEAMAYHFWGLAYLWSGQYSEAMKKIDISISKFQKIEDHWYEGLSLSYQGVAEYYQAHYRKSLHIFQEYLDLSQKYDITVGIALSKIYMAVCLLEQGDYQASKSLLNQAQALCTESNMKFFLCITFAYLGYLDLEEEDYTQAVSHLQNAAQLDRTNNFMENFTGMIYPLLAESCLKKALRERHQKSDSEWRKELDTIGMLCKEAISRTRRWVNNYPISLRVTAMYDALIGKRKKAFNKFYKSIYLLQKLGREYELAKSYYEFSVLLSAGGQAKEAEDHLRRSHNLFLSIGAKSYIAKTSLPEAERGIRRIDNPHETDSPRNRLHSQLRMETLSVISCMLSSILDLDMLLGKILDSAIELLGAERGFLLMYPETGGSDLEIKVTRNVNQSEPSGQISHSIIDHVIWNRQTLIITEAMSDSMFKNQASIVTQELRSVICVPIMNRDLILGLIYLDNHYLKGIFDEEDRKVLELIASQAGVSIVNAQLYYRLKIYSKELEESRDEIARWNQTLEQRVQERTHELNQLIEQLKEHARTVEELAIAKERNRLAMNVHDTLGNTMTLLIKLLEASKVTIGTHPEKSEARINDAIIVARNGFAELKRSIKGLATEKLEPDTLERVLQELAKEYQATGVQIGFEIAHISPSFDKQFVFEIFKVCQEAVTNAIRHGKAKNIRIHLQMEDGFIKLIIKDNGEGCNCLVKGTGLSGMEQRVRMFGGNIAFHSMMGEGFEIQIQIPIKGGSN